jgi:DNA replicative helicase MCM subunit Mcm2 (Cdc46/Mcm family)
MPTLIGANRAFCGEFQTEVGMPARSALRFPCRRRHGNRILIIACRRQQLLPDGGHHNPLARTGLDRLLAAALKHARGAGQIRLNDPAREQWHHTYRQLANQPADGIVDQITARAEAHIIRLALLYALTDGAQQIGPAHLHAAVALHDYAARSAAWALTGATGQPLAEQIHAALRQHPGGLSRSQISNLLRHNQPAGEIDTALQALHTGGRATVTRQATGGRPAQIWTASASGA